LHVSARIPDRAIDLSLGAMLAVAPLLPTGPRYLGYPRLAYVELLVPALAFLWVAARLAGSRTARPPLPGLPLAAWLVTLAVVMGSCAYALMFHHRLDSMVFLRQLSDAVTSGALWMPMHHLADPFYPLRVALTFAEGSVVFLLVADLCRRAGDPPRRAWTALAGWVTGMAAVGGFAVFQYVTAFQLHPYWVKANPAIVRSHATLEDPNALGAYFALAIGLLAGFLRYDRSRRRWLWLGCLAIAALGLATTWSRAALGAALVAPLFTFAVGPRPATRWQAGLRTAGRAIAALLVVVLVGSAAYRMSASESRRTQPDNQVELVVRTFDPRESPDWVLRGRVAWWSAAVGMIRDHPLTGVGLGRYPRLMTEYGGGRSRENAHNLYLQMIAEAGLPGLMFTALAIALLAGLVRLRRRAGTDGARALALGGFIGCLAYLMTLLTGHSLLLPSGQILLAAALGAVFAGASPAEPVIEPRHPRAVRVAVCLVAAGALVYYPLAASARGIAPVPDAWGYSWGLHATERPADGAAFRWTTGRALLDLTVPADATALELPVSARGPNAAGEYRNVRVTLDGRTEEVVLGGGPQTIRIPLPAGRNRILVELDVSPTFVPAVEDGEGDTRVLGIQLFRPVFRE
jgi:O-antigen ligase